MEEFVRWYMSVGASIYLVFLLKDMVSGFKKFEGAGLLSVFRGLFGSLFLWPLLVWLMEIEP